MIKVAGLWKNTDKNGNIYYSGNVNMHTRVVVMSNKFKTDPKHPDFEIYFDEAKKIEQKEVEGLPQEL